MTFDDRFRFGVHAVILNDDGRALQLKQTYGDRRWGLPGGGVEPGETIHQAIARECAEELGTSVELGPLTGVYYHSRVNAQVVIFRASLPEGCIINLSSEHSDYDWFCMEELGDIQRLRVMDAVNYSGEVVSRAF